MATSASVRAGRAFVELFADNSKLQQGLRVAEAQLKEFGAKVSTMGRQLATLGGIALLPAAISTKIFAGFDDQMRAVQAVTGSTGIEFDKLTEKAKFLGRTTSFTAQEVASGMLELGRAGFKSDEIDAGTASVMNLARATQTEIPRATEIAGNALRGFGLKASDTQMVADILTTTANNSAQTLDDLGESFKHVAPIAFKAGMSLKDTAKVLGTLANFGIKGSLAGTTVKNILTRMADPEVQASYEKLGVSVKDSQGNLRGMADVLQEVGQAAADLPNAEKLALFKELFDMRALAGGATLTADGFQSLNDALDNCEGEAERVAKTMDAGIGGAFRMLLSAVEGTAIAIGSTLAPEIKKFADYLTEATTRLTDWLNEHKEMIISCTKAAAKVFLFGVGLLAVGSAASAVANIIGMFRGALTVIRTVVSALCTDLSVLGTNFSAIGAVIGPVVSALSSVGAAMATAFSAKAGGFLALTNKEAYTATAAAISQAWASASSAVATSFNAMRNAAAGVLSGVASLFTQTTGAIQSFSLASTVAAVKTAALATVQKISVAVMGVARAGYAGITAIIGLFSIANITAAASVVKVTTVSLLAKGAVGAYGVAVALCTGAVQAFSAAMMLLCAHPVMAALTAIGLVLAGVCIYLKDAGKYTAQLSDDMSKLAEAGNKTRSLDQTKMEGVEKLSKKSEQGSLNDKEFEKGKAWVEELTGRYGDLGFEIDEVNKRIIAATDSQKKFLEAMNQQALQQKDSVIAEEERNLAELEKERKSKMDRMEGWAGYGAATVRNIGRVFTLGTGVVDSAETAWTKQMDEQYKKIDEQRKKLSELRKERRLLAGGDATVAAGGNVEDSVRQSVADIDGVATEESRKTETDVTKFEEEQRRAKQSEWENKREDIATKWEDYRTGLQKLIDAESAKSKPNDEQVSTLRNKLAQSWKGEEEEVSRALQELAKNKVEEGSLSDEQIAHDQALQTKNTKQIALDMAQAQGDIALIRRAMKELKEAEHEVKTSEYKLNKSKYDIASEQMAKALHDYLNAGDDTKAKEEARKRYEKAREQKAAVRPGVQEERFIELRNEVKRWGVRVKREQSELLRLVVGRAPKEKVEKQREVIEHMERRKASAEWMLDVEVNDANIDTNLIEARKDQEIKQFELRRAQTTGNGAVIREAQSNLKEANYSVAQFEYQKSINSVIKAQDKFKNAEERYSYTKRLGMGPQERKKTRSEMNAAKEEYDKAVKEMKMRGFKLADFTGPIELSSKGTFNPFEAVAGQDNWQRRILEETLRVQKEIANNTRQDDGMI